VIIRAIPRAACEPQFTAMSPPPSSVRANLSPLAVGEGVAMANPRSCYLDPPPQPDGSLLGREGVGAMGGTARTPIPRGEGPLLTFWFENLKMPHIS